MSTSSVAVNYDTTKAVTRRVAANVRPTYADAPTNTKPIIFRYFRYPASGSGIQQPTEEIAAGQNRALTASELTDVARIDFDYRVLTSQNNSAGSTALENSIYVRTGNPYDSTSPGPTCTAAY